MVSIDETNNQNFHFFHSSSSNNDEIERHAYRQKENAEQTNPVLFVNLTHRVNNRTLSCSSSSPTVTLIFSPTCD